MCHEKACQFVGRQEARDARGCLGYLTKVDAEAEAEKSCEKPLEKKKRFFVLLREIVCNTLLPRKMASASSSRGLLTLFPDLNESTRERTGAVALEPQPSAPEFAPLNFPMRSVEQRMAVQTDIEANQYTLKSCVETMTAVTNLSHRLQSRTNEVQQLNAQLALLQRMYKDARAEISVLKAENKELKRKASFMFRFGGPPYAAVEEQGVVIMPSGVGNTEATPARAAQDGGKKKRPAE
ncbi:hypothetical protein TEA_011872 [Camellia sinensis var. sinensis]|uniref:Uncharacterized protein n=1 Tax=Camellia sinensis var. sinensis TaxID=542762 RepID=A0A4S4DXC8_CAMSN|nr:hypothetical protein TEA_011872 [Camellia sinensis var. sinensis]